MNPIIRACLALTAAIGGAAQAAEAPASKPYVTEFCGPIAFNDAGTAALMDQLRQWDAKAAPDVEADAARPEDAEAPGQLFRFPDPGAPKAFVDRRRGVCSLVYPGARTPAPVTEEMAHETLPVNAKGQPSPWRRTARARFGPPGPVRYFMKLGEGPGFGLCTAIFEDLRLKDGAPATLVRVSTCRLASDEKLDNG